MILRMRIEWNGKKIKCLRYIAEKHPRAHVGGVLGKVDREIGSWTFFGPVSDTRFILQKSCGTLIWSFTE